MRPFASHSIPGAIWGLVSCFRAVDNRPYIVVSHFLALLVGAHEYLRYSLCALDIAALGT